MAKPNILLIAVDTLRADHIGCYGYPRPTTPNIDRLATQGTRFSNYFVNHFPTQPSFTTLFTGLDAIEHDIVAHGNPRRLLSPKIPMLAERLKGAGYTTAASDNLVTPRTGAPSWFARGFDHYLGFQYDPGQDTQSRMVTSRALTLLEHIKDEQFFLFVHYWDPHSPYWPPKDTPNFSGSPGDAKDPLLADVFEKKGAFGSKWILRSMLMDDVTRYDHILGRYDESIWASDREVGRMIDALTERKLDRDTLVIFLSDHGEAFGEFEVDFDHSGPADANLHVPLIMRLPGEIDAGKVVDEYVQTLDVTTAILEFAGVKKPEPFLGRGLFGNIPKLPFVVSAESNRQSNWILRTNEWKLVLPSIDPKTGEPHPDLRNQPRPHATLHDMRKGAREDVDVSTTHPEIATRLEKEMRHWLDSRLQGRPDPVGVQGPIWPYAQFIATWRAKVEGYEGKYNKKHHWLELGPIGEFNRAAMTAGGVGAGVTTETVQDRFTAPPRPKSDT